MRHVDHVVGVDGSEGCEAVADNGEQGDQHVVDDVDGIELLLANIDPADEEEHPGEAEEGDEGGVQRDEKAQRPRRVLAERLEPLLHLGPARVEHMADVVVDKLDVLLAPALQCRIVRQYRVLGRR